MIKYHHPKFTLDCYLKHSYVHFNLENNSTLFESTGKKIDKEEDISAYLDIVFQNEKQIHALLYCVYGGLYEQ